MYHLVHERLTIAFSIALQKKQLIVVPDVKNYERRDVEDADDDGLVFRNRLPVTASART